MVYAISSSSQDELQLGEAQAQAQAQADRRNRASRSDRKYTEKRDSPNGQLSNGSDVSGRKITCPVSNWSEHLSHYTRNG
ncbi:hypothetical protein DPV78_011906 [Talaromyces pinophilus]|nr:hypothetical protein DPV78_011906 [Talaromyces pinophilus]